MYLYFDLVLQKKAIIDAAYAAVAQFTALVSPGLAKSTAVNVLLSFLQVPEKGIFDQNSRTTEWYDLPEFAKNVDDDEDSKRDSTASNGMKQGHVLIIIVLVYLFFKNIKQ